MFLTLQRLGGALSSHLRRSLTMSTKLGGRPSSTDVSLDSQLMAENPGLVKAHLTARRSGASLLEEIDRIADLRKQRSTYLNEGESARSAKKKDSQVIGKLLKEGKKDEAEAMKVKVEDYSKLSSEADEKLAVVDAEIKKIALVIPNLLDDRVPEGIDDKDNTIVFSWNADARKIGSNFMWHDDIAVGLGGLNTESAAKISGARFSVLTGQVARLERALVQYFLDFHVSRGYEEISVPYIVSRSTLQGTGQLPKFEEDLFKVNHQVSGEDAFLIPTAEVPVTNLFRDQIVDEAKLPISMVCHSPCFRAEAGSYGRDTRGLLRQHQFQKVELVKICTPETSAAEHEKMTGDAEALLQSLDLPYRKVLLCSGDIGFSARICYDLEVWLPGQQEYREISSISNCNNFQSQRMFLRYKSSVQQKDEKAKKGPQYPHTLNGSGVAVGRALVAVLENHQQPDGSVIVPEKLRPYMGGLETIVPRKTL